MSSMFDTPLRSAALGVMIVAGIALLRGLLQGQGRPYRASLLVLTTLALGMILISETLQ